LHLEKQSFLSCGDPLQHFGAAPQEINYRPQKVVTARKEMVIKVHHAEKSLQLVDILRVGARVNCGYMYGRNCVAVNFQSWNCNNTFCQLNGKAIGGQGGKKCFQLNEMCVVCVARRIQPVQIQGHHCEQAEQ
jgi:hypothetical protein